MREYEFSLTLVLPYKDAIVDSVLIWEMWGSENPPSCIFYVLMISSPKFARTVKN